MTLRALAIGALVFAFPVLAQQDSTMAADTVSADAAAHAILAKLHYQGGRISLEGGVATLTLSDRFRFLDADGARVFLVEAWGNPPSVAAGALGLIVPTGVTPWDDESWAVVVRLEEDGYVDDKDAATIDYAKLLREMQRDTDAASKDRVKAGYESMRLVGWAEPPSYDSAASKLYWAKELTFGENDHRSLNYDVRALGRRGVLVLSAVAGMEQLPAIQAGMQELLRQVEFNPGHRYADFVPGTDKLAEYGLAGLVAGTLAVKSGLFKGLIAILLAAKKALLAGVVAVGAGVKAWWGRRQVRTVAE